MAPTRPAARRLGRPAAPTGPAAPPAQAPALGAGLLGRGPATRRAGCAGAEARDALGPPPQYGKPASAVSQRTLRPAAAAAAATAAAAARSCYAAAAFLACGTGPSRRGAWAATMAACLDRAGGGRAGKGLVCSGCPYLPSPCHPSPCSGCPCLLVAPGWFAWGAGRERAREVGLVGWKAERGLHLA